MANPIEELISKVFSIWKKNIPSSGDDHPDEELLAAFLEHKLSGSVGEKIKAHCVLCAQCAQRVAEACKLPVTSEDELPDKLKVWTKEKLAYKEDFSTDEIIIKKEGMFLKILSSCADVLLGQEVVPVTVLRSKNKDSFEKQLLLFKDLGEIQTEIKIQLQENNRVTLTVYALDKKTKQPFRDCRISLLKDKTELESYVAVEGKATFEEVIGGRYTISITSIKQEKFNFVLELIL
ncbi:MAG: hypothetical protein N2606_02565 [Candidatus Omnitrophica bacterium]|nr:hypothetical protein [Candidatus Omnitrophota bacterium]